MTQLYSSGDVAARLKVPQYKILYAIENGMVADSSMRVGGKRIFSDEDLRRLAEHFQVEITFEEIDEQKKKKPNEL